MSDLIKHFGLDERGATATEYALLIVFVALVVGDGTVTTYLNISNLFNNIGAYLSKIQMPPLP